MPVDPETVSQVFAGIAEKDIYKRFGLRRNPFPASGDPPSDPSIPPYPDILDKITVFVSSFLRTKQSQGLVLLGDYGTGKSYHLNWIRSLLEAKPEVRTRVVRIETPGVEPYDLVRQIVRHLGDQEVARVIWSMVMPRIAEEAQREGNRYFAKFAEASARPRRGPDISLQDSLFEVPLVKLNSDTLLDYRKFLKAFDEARILSRERLRDQYLPLLYRKPDEDGLGITESPSVARELANLCFLSGNRAIESWERLTTPGIRGGLEVRGEVEYLRTVVRLLVMGRTEYFVLLLDEFEKVPLMQSMTSREMRHYLDTVRMLLDAGWEEEKLPFAWVVASHDEAWDVVKTKLDTPLSQRFVEVSLRRTEDRHVATYLIREHLKLVRLSPSPDESLSPFPDDLVDLIPPELRHTPRDLLRLCYGLLEEAVQTGTDDNERVSYRIIQDYLNRQPRQPTSGSSEHD